MWHFLALSPLHGAGPPGFGQKIYSHHSWLVAAAACELVHHHAAQGKCFCAELEAAEIRNVDRSWKRSFLIKPDQDKQR